MEPRLKDDELEHDEPEERSGIADEVPFDPWGDEEDASERRRDPLRGPASHEPDAV